MYSVVRVIFALTVNINFDFVDSQEIRRIVWNRKVITVSIGTANIPYCEAKIIQATPSHPFL
jgi:hypothetical protein